MAWSSGDRLIAGELLNWIATLWCHRRPQAELRRAADAERSRLRRLAVAVTRVAIREH